MNHQRKEIVIAFGGTSGLKQVFWEAWFVLLHPKLPISLSRAGTVWAQDYFVTSFNTLNKLFISGFIEIHKALAYRLVFTGHSLGGGIASIAALYYSRANDWPGPAPRLYTFGMPRVGDYDYARVHDQYVRDSWRLTHNSDLVPHLPWCPGEVVKDVRFCTAQSTYPYHHGYEVFYGPMSDMMDPYRFTECIGLPINEDKLCSNVYPWPVFLANGIIQHRCYFGQLVGDWCEKGTEKSRCS